MKDHDRIGIKLIQALFAVIAYLNKDSLCLLCAKAFHLLDEQTRREAQAVMASKRAGDDDHELQE